MNSVRPPPSPSTQDSDLPEVPAYCRYLHAELNHLRPRTRVLFVHNGSDGDGHINYLTDAGMRVDDVGVDGAVLAAVRFQPDIIVLDLAADNEVIAQLKRNAATTLIPIIAFADLSD